MTTKATRDVIDLSIRPVLSVDIDGGTIDGVTLGATTPVSGTFSAINTGTLQISTSADFTGAAITGLSSFYADLAEYYESDMPLQTGNVVRIGGDKEITITTIDADPEAFGIISTEPAFVMNAEVAEGRWHYPVALIGRVPCLVDGPVRKGEKLVATVGGVARAAQPHEYPLAFARSLSTCNKDEVRQLEVTTTVR